MRILHYLSEIVLAQGGVVRAVLDLCDALARHGHEVSLLTFDDRDAPPAWKSSQTTPGRPRVVTLPWPRGPKPLRRFSPHALSYIEALVSNSDIVHLHVPWENTNKQVAATCRRGPGAGAGDKGGKPYVVSIHGMLDDWAMAQSAIRKRAFLGCGARAMLEHAACVLCTAQAERDQARRHIPRAALEVLPLILDFAPFGALPTRDVARRGVASLGASSLPIAPDTPLIVFLSRLHEKKGLERLIDAVPLLHAGGVRPILLIAGSADPVTTPPGYERSLHARAAASGRAEHIRFLGHVSGADKVNLLRAADLSVLPTSQENWGFSLVESLACATPILTTKGVDIWRELESSGGALPTLALPVTAQALAGAIAPALQNLARLRSLGDAGRSWALRELDPESITAKYEHLYRTLTTRNPA